MTKTPGDEIIGNYWLSDLEEGRERFLQKECPVYSSTSKCRGPPCSLYDHCDQQARVEINGDVGNILHGLSYVKDALDVEVG